VAEANGDELANEGADHSVAERVGGDVEAEEGTRTEVVVDPVLIRPRSTVDATHEGIFRRGTWGAATERSEVVLADEECGCFIHMGSIEGSVDVPGRRHEERIRCSPDVDEVAVAALGCAVASIKGILDHLRTGNDDVTRQLGIQMPLHGCRLEQVITSRHGYPIGQIHVDHLG